MLFQVIRVGYNTFDVFEGNQWADWSRIKAGRNGVYVAKGRSLPHALVKVLASAINPFNASQLVEIL
jgi:hypothetical protein